MAEEQYFESDLYLLQQLFFPSAKAVFLLDPEGWVKPNFNSEFIRVADQSSVKHLSHVNEGMVLINMTNIPVKRYPVQTRAVEGVISFASKGETFPDFTTDRFYFVRNDIETLRWVFPNNLRKPLFLSYYDRDAAYGYLFQGYCHLSGLMNQMRWVADGNFTVLHPSGLFFEHLSGGPYQSFTLFTKDFFDKGVALLQLVSQDKAKAYAKLPATKEGEALVSHEAETLQALNQHAFRYIAFPKAERESGLLQLSNAMNHRHKAFTKWEKHHFRGLGEYTRAFATTTTLETFLKQEQVIEKLQSLKQAIREEELPAGLGPSNVAGLYQSLTQVVNNLPLDKTITLSLVHGDFTEENLSLEENKLILVDWEDARFNWPALGDVMDFITYRMEEEGPPDLEAFADEWHKLVRHEAFRVLVAEFAPDTLLHFRVFWFIKALSYIWRFLNKGYQPYYVNWRIYFWRQLLAEYAAGKEWLDVPAPKAPASNG